MVANECVANPDNVERSMKGNRPSGDPENVTSGTGAGMTAKKKGCLNSGSKIVLFVDGDPVLSRDLGICPGVQGFSPFVQGLWDF